MSYTLFAFIGPANSLRQQAAQLPAAQVVTLPHGYALIPLAEAIKSAFAPAERVASFWQLTTTLFDRATELSALGSLGYFEIDMFGGWGERSAVLWHNTQVVAGPTLSEDTMATEQLFSLLGVPITTHHDRFDALQLGRYRRQEDWLKQL